jgi:1-acyl-sn-glycerol-3-phosphate acyltransferase
VVAETRSTDEARKGELQQAVAQRVNDVLGAPADEVIIAAPHAIPKTSSGKIRRSATCQLFETGRLGAPARAVWVQMLRLRLTSATARLRHFLKSAADLGYAAYWWAVLTSFGAMTWLGVLASPGRARSWSMVRMMARATINLMRIPVKVHGLEHFAEGRHIVAVNHSSYFDSLVLASILPGEPAFVAKSELSRQIIAGPFLRKLGARFAERTDMEESLKEVGAYKSLAAAGEQLVFFPEATFLRTPGLLPFRLGAFAIACAADTPILPIVLNGTRSILRGEQWFPRRGAVTVEVLEQEACGGQDFEAVVRLRDRVRDKILAKCGEPDLAEKLVVFEPRG